MRLNDTDTEAVTSGRDPIGGAFPVILIILAIIGQMLAAVNLSAHADLLRNVAVALVGVLLIFALFKGEVFGQGNGLPLALSLLTVWTILRLMADGSLALTWLSLNSWLLFSFFAAYTARVSSSRVLKLVLLFTFASSTMYLYTVATQGLRGGLLINAVFYVLLCLPFVLSVSHALTRRIGFLTIVIIVASSNKRTAFIALIIALILFLIASKTQARFHRVRNHRTLSLLTGLALSTLIAHWFASTFLGVDVLEKFGRLGEDGGSGRAEIYMWVLERIYTSSGADLWFGRGINAVARDTGGVSAHNDFLEIAYDYGLIGFLLYLMVFVSLAGSQRQLTRRGSNFAGPWAASLGIFLVMSLFSHVIFVPTYVGLLGLFWGHVLRSERTSTYFDE